MKLSKSWRIFQSKSSKQCYFLQLLIRKRKVLQNNIWKQTSAFSIWILLLKLQTWQQEFHSNWTITTCSCLLSKRWTLCSALLRVIHSQNALSSFSLVRKFDLCTKLLRNWTRKFIWWSFMEGRNRIRELLSISTLLKRSLLIFSARTLLQEEWISHK